MNPYPYTEDTLVQQITAEYLRQQLGWESVYAYNNEDFGPDSLLGRASDREVVLTRTLKEKLVELNPDLPDEAYDDAVRQITVTVASQTLVATNREKHDLIRNGVQAKIGSITSKWEHFHEWKRLGEQEPGAVEMETLLKGVCDKQNFMDLVENFILFDESSGEPKKILARNHQFLGVNLAIEAVCERKERKGKLGVFWHTQGAGKSYSIVMFTRKVHRKLGGNFTFLVLTDRDDLDTQIYKTFAGCGVVDHDRDPCRASSGEHLSRLLGEHKSHVFSLIQKFNKDVDPDEGYTQRDDIIVVTDEAHRTQYGTLALNMHNALPNASYIGFTGTPLFKDDEITRRVFGGYVSTYDFQRAGVTGNFRSA